MIKIKPNRYVRAFLNPHDIVLVRYAEFDGRKSNGLFYIVYTEGADEACYRDERNFTCLKISSNSQDKYSVKLTPDETNRLSHISYLNASKLMTFATGQIIHKVGSVTGNQRHQCNKHIARFVDTIQKTLGI